MRRTFLSVLVLASLLTGLDSCKKGDTGPAGPAGPTGAKGADGAAGAKGATGADGTKILSGTTDPGGQLGDYWFNPTTKTLYGPKTATGWGTGTVLGGNGANGATGATGATGVTGGTGPAGPAGAPGTAGPAGATGAKGDPGTQFLSGAGAPSSATGNVGDYYFDTNTSTFYGPKVAGATPWVANVFPIGAANAAKTFYLTVGLDKVTQVYRKNGQDHKAEFDKGEISASQFYFNADDRNRISRYPGWGLNREMIFESVPGSGIFDKVPQSANDFGYSQAELDDPIFHLGGVNGWARVNMKFRYTQNFSGASNYDGTLSSGTQEFTLSQVDINRMKEAAGEGFKYWTYAAFAYSSSPATPTVHNPDLSKVADGDRINFYRIKNASVFELADAQANTQGKYHAEYSAESYLNLNTIAGLGAKLEKYKQDGKVFLKYRYVNPLTGNTIFATSSKFGDDTPAGSGSYNNGNQAGWYEATPYLYNYTLGGVTYGPGDVMTTQTWPAIGGSASLHGVTVAGGGVQGFDVFNQGYLWGYNVNPAVYAEAGPYPSTNRTTQHFGGYTHKYWILQDQSLEVVGKSNTIARSGEFRVNWKIQSGSNWGDTATKVPFGPITLVNPNNSINPVDDSWVGGNYYTGMYNYYNPLLGVGNTTIPYWKDGVPANNYYRVNANNLFGSVLGTAVTVGHPAYANFLSYNVLPEVRIKNGKPASWFQGKPLVQVQVFVIPGDIVKAAAARGINVNNAAALSQFADSYGK
ncbi:hypothetical protein [Niabella sp.]|uniref:hypothetical protein n=1 Tax=Niabella sp. TaxID=1962976 RepID=UPI00261DCCB7|nr:hypothetical protein [Niabella sp.]